MDKYIIFLYILIGILIINEISDKYVEKNTNTDISANDVKRIFIEDIQAIKNINDVSKIIMDRDGKLVLPNLTVNGNFETLNNIESTGYGQFGVARIGSGHGGNWAQFAHKDRFNNTDYALIHHNSGATIINCKSGNDHGHIRIRKNNSDSLGVINVENLVGNVNVDGNISATNNDDTGGNITAETISGNILSFGNELLEPNYKFRVHSSGNTCVLQTSLDKIYMSSFGNHNKKNLITGDLDAFTIKSSNFINDLIIPANSITAQNIIASNISWNNKLLKDKYLSMLGSGGSGVAKLYVVTRNMAESDRYPFTATQAKEALEETLLDPLTDLVGGFFGALAGSRKTG